MADSNRTGSNNPAHKNRRTSEVNRMMGGVSTGDGRTSSPVKKPKSSRAARIAIGCSFLFSLGLVGWAFALPFRSTSPSISDDLKDLPVAEQVKLEYEARMSSQAYVDYTREIDRRLLDQIDQTARQNGPRLPSKRELRRQWEQRIKQRVKQLDQMRAQNKGEAFLKGTLEWQNQKELQDLLDDAPQKF